MKDRSLPARLLVVLMIVVVAAGTFSYTERLYANGMPLRDIALFVLGLLVAMMLLPLLLRGLQAIADTRVGRTLRAAIALTFSVALVSTLYFGFIAPISKGAISEFGYTALMTSGAVTLLTAPIGWRALTSYLTGRSAAALPFFRASPLALAITFALAAIFFAMAASLPDALAGMGQKIEAVIASNTLLLLAAVLLFGVMVVAPLVFLLRLLRMGGERLRQRFAQH